MNFGRETSEADSFAILDQALESGINFVDTADVYGGPQSPDIAQGYGISEEFIGRWLAQGGRREQIVLATKVYQPMGLGRNEISLSEETLQRPDEIWPGPGGEAPEAYALVAKTSHMSVIDR